MKAMILAAGLGTRLAPFTHHHPKALAKVGEMTLLEWNIRYLQSFGISEVVVNVHHFADQIEAAINASNGWGSTIHISDERNQVLETGGGVLKAASFFEGETSILVLNVDVLTDLDLSVFIDIHHRHSPLATLAVIERKSSRYLLFDEQMNLKGWRNEKTGEQKGVSGKEFAFTGIQIISSALLRSTQRNGKFSLIDLYLDAILSGGEIKGYNHSGDRFLDVGKPETLAVASDLFGISK